MKNLIIVLSVILSLMFIFSCSDSTNNPTEKKKNYLPSATGNFWVYSSYDTDSSGAKVSGSDVIDSNLVTGGETKFSKEAIVVAHYEDGEFIENYYFFTDGLIIETLANYFFPGAEDLGGIDIPIDIPEAWLKIADVKNTTWNINDQNFSDIPLGLDIITGKLSGSLLITGTDLGNSTVNVMGQSKQARVFNIQYKIIGTFIDDTFGLRLPVSAIISNKFYYVDGIGLVMRELLPFVVDIGDGTYKIPYGGSVDMLINYNVALPD